LKGDKTMAKQQPPKDEQKVPQEMLVMVAGASASADPADQPVHKVEPGSFEEVLAMRLAKHPVLKSLGAEVLTLLADNFDTWREIQTYGAEHLVADGFGVTDKQASALVNVANTEATTEEAVQAAAAATTETMHVTAEVTQTATAEPAKVNKYLAAIGGLSSIGLGNTSVMSVRIKPAFLERGAKAVAAYIVLGTGVDTIFSDEFWANLGIEDLEAQDATYQWDKDRLSGTWVRPDALQQMFQSMPDMFGENWNQVMKLTAELSSSLATQKLLGTGAQYGVKDAPSYAALGTLIPAVASHMSTALTQSRVPAIARGAIEMVEALMEVLRMQGIQSAAGVWSPDQDPDTGVIRFLEKKVDASVGSAFQLAIIAEQMVRLIGICPQPGQIDADYLEAFGQLAVQYQTLHALVTGQGVSGKPDAGFRPEASMATEQTRRWSFTLNLSFRRS